MFLTSLKFSRSLFLQQTPISKMGLKKMNFPRHPFVRDIVVRRDVVAEWCTSPGPFNSLLKRHNTHAENLHFARRNPRPHTAYLHLVRTLFSLSRAGDTNTTGFNSSFSCPDLLRSLPYSAAAQLSSRRALQPRANTGQRKKFFVLS